MKMSDIIIESSSDQYRANVIRDMAERIKRSNPEDKKTIFRLTNMSPEVMDKFWSSVLYPAVVKHDYPQQLSLDYWKMIDDLIAKLRHQKP